MTTILLVDREHGEPAATHRRQRQPALLHNLLCEALYQPVNWSTVGQSEALHLLRRLFGTTHEKKES